MHGVYVFRDRPPADPSVLFFDGTDLRELPVPPAEGGVGGVPPEWGCRSRGAEVTALMLCCHCGVPADLLLPVARKLRDEWVRFLPPDPTCVPAWVVNQEVVRLCIREMSDRNGK